MEARRPAKGEAWDTFEHRAADALVALCESVGRPVASSKDAAEILGLP